MGIHLLVAYLTDRQTGDGIFSSYAYMDLVAALCVFQVATGATYHARFLRREIKGITPLNT